MVPTLGTLGTLARGMRQSIHIAPGKVCWIHIGPLECGRVVTRSLGVPVSSEKSEYSLFGTRLRVGGLTLATLHKTNAE